MYIPSKNVTFVESRGGLLDLFEVEKQDLAISLSENKVSIRWRAYLKGSYFQ